MAPLGRAFVPGIVPTSRSPLLATLTTTKHWLIPPRNWGHKPQCRHYAQSSKKPNGPPRDLIFTPQDVAPLEKWEQTVMIPDGITPKDCFNAAGWFCSLASASESTWKGRIVRDYGIDPYLMHWTALQLLQHPIKNTKLAAYILRTAAEFDYDPSVIAFVRFFQESLGEPSSRQARIFLQPITDRFTKLVKEGRNPDALTLQALIELSKGKRDKALSHFNRAIVAAASGNNIFAPALTKHDHLNSRMVGPSTDSQREPRWCSEAECYYHLGVIQAHRGHLEAAEASFRVGALELDDARSYLELAKLLPKESPEHRAHLIKAAISGNRDALPLLCTYESERSAGERGRDGPLWAREWALVWKDGQADVNVSPAP